MPVRASGKLARGCRARNFQIFTSSSPALCRTSAATDQTRLWDGLRRFDGNEMETLQSADKLDDFGYDRCGEQTTGDTGKDKAKGNDLADEDSEDRVVLAELKRLADYGSGKTAV
eukprot:scaffold756_cov281-Pinguiococcus_pyrenoidosus.AAC.5